MNLIKGLVVIVALHMLSCSHEKNATITAKLVTTEFHPNWELCDDTIPSIQSCVFIYKSQKYIKSYMYSITNNSIDTIYQYSNPMGLNWFTYDEYKSSSILIDSCDKKAVFADYDNEVIIDRCDTIPFSELEQHENAFVKVEGKKRIFYLLGDYSPLREK